MRIDDHGIDIDDISGEEPRVSRGARAVTPQAGRLDLQVVPVSESSRRDGAARLLYLVLIGAGQVIPPLPAPDIRDIYQLVFRLAQATEGDPHDTTGERHHPLGATVDPRDRDPAFRLGLRPAQRVGRDRP